MNDFEKHLKDALNRSVDDQLGPRRSAPPLGAKAGRGRDTRRGRRPGPWLLPLLAAACVAAVVGGAVGISHLASGKSQPPAATATPSPVPTPTGAPTTPTPSSDVTPSKTGNPSTSTRSGPGAGGQASGSVGSSSTASGSTTPADVGSLPPGPPVRAQVGPASLVLPHGWVARDLTAIFHKISNAGGGHVWCLSPSSQTAKQNYHKCPINLSPDIERAQPDPDVIAGTGDGTDVYCGPEEPRPPSFEQAGTKLLGGRAAAWRLFTYDCPSGVRTVEQYLVPTLPAYLMYVMYSTPDLHAVLTEIAENSSLPAQAAPLPYVLRGYLRTVHRESDGVHVTIDRAIRRFDGVDAGDPSTKTYVVPADVFDRIKKAGRIGHVVLIRSDGHTVNDFMPG